MSSTVLTDLSDGELVTRLEALCAEGHRLLARMIEYLIEVDERRLHLKASCSSLFEFCLRRLGMSEGAAFRRINAARLVRRFPSLLVPIARGELHLSSLVLLRDHLTAENVDELAHAASRRSKREVEELLARRAPRPDVPATIRKLRAPVAPAPLAQAPAQAAELASAAAQASAALASTGLPASPLGERPARARIDPLSEARHRLQLTISTAARAKLERARDLMRHRNPSGGLEVVVELALDALLEKLEKQRLGKTERPRQAPRHIPPARVSRKAPAGVSRSARRAVFARDGEQCTFVDEEGRRCAARAFLELDHVESRALGGSDEASNLRVMCRAHNRLHAEEVFGRPHVDGRIHFRQRKCEVRSGPPLADTS